MEFLNYSDCLFVEMWIFTLFWCFGLFKKDAILVTGGKSVISNFSLDFPAFTAHSRFLILATLPQLSSQLKKQKNLITYVHERFFFFTYHLPLKQNYDSKKLHVNLQRNKNSKKTSRGDLIASIQLQYVRKWNAFSIFNSRYEKLSIFLLTQIISISQFQL
jgi:hypothetical protein